MLKMFRRKTATLIFAVFAVLGVAVAATAGTTGSGVTFISAGKDTIYLYIRYGTGSSCSDQRTSKNLKLTGGETAKVNSGNSMVC
ncbi:MAG TPA: hypothetical protein VGH73_02625 [Thermoanaerobaculia bacterium]